LRYKVFFVYLGKAYCLSDFHWITDERWDLAMPMSDASIHDEIVARIVTDMVHETTHIVVGRRLLDA